MSNNATPQKAAEESMVVRLSRLDKMLELAGEVIIVSSNLGALSHQLNEGIAVTRELSEDIKDLSITSSRISSDLHNLVTDVRTVDMRDLFARFRRLARDTSRRLGKAIDFQVEGEDISIDKKVSEKIYEPIAHQIRNAMAHGIEDEETRRKAGKDPLGHVTVRVRNLDNATAIEVMDDGRGINREKTLKTALEMGLVTQEKAASITDDELFEFLYLPGFSTAESASATSGRGVGMDVVRTVMNEISGETRIETEPGKGTVFTFLLPLVTAVNISDAFLVKARNICFAFPISAVLASQAVPRKEISTTAEKGRTIMYLGHILPLFDLLEVFGEPPLEPQGDKVSVLILEHKHHRLAYVVSEFLSPQKIVISEFDDTMNIPGLSGTATLSGRRMGMVVDMGGFVDQTLGLDSLADQTPATLLLEKRLSQADEKPAVEKQAAPTATEGSPAGNGVETMDSEFQEELGSMLAKLNQELLELEEKKDKETADGIFRLVHSIKGDLTMYGAEVPASTTHQVETVLAQVRDGKLELTGEVFDVLFDGSSYLDEVLETVSQGGAPPQPPQKLVEGLERYKPAESATEAKVIDLDNAEVELDPTGEFYLSSRRREGATTYQCRLRFNPGDQPHFLVAYLILRRIQNIADVLGTLPTMSDLESGLCQDALIVLFAPRKEDPEQLKKLEENLRLHFGVSRFELAPFV